MTVDVTVCSEIETKAEKEASGIISVPEGLSVTVDVTVFSAVERDVEEKEGAAPQERPERHTSPFGQQRFSPHGGSSGLHVTPAGQHPSILVHGMYPSVVQTVVSPPPPGLHTGVPPSSTEQVVPVRPARRRELFTVFKFSKCPSFTRMEKSLQHPMPSEHAKVTGGQVCCLFFEGWLPGKRGTKPPFTKTFALFAILDEAIRWVPSAAYSSVAKAT